MSEHDRSKVAAPEDHLAEQFRQLKILRAKVRQAEAELSRRPGDKRRCDIAIDRLARPRRSRTAPNKNH